MCSSLTYSLTMQRSADTAPFYSPRHSSSTMKAGSSKHPPSWRLWHHSQGIVFKQPLYPALDVARFFTEASTVRGYEVNSSDSTTAPIRIESNFALGESFMERREDREIAEEGAVETFRTAQSTCAIGDLQERIGGLQLGSSTQANHGGKAQGEENEADSPGPHVQPNASAEPADSCYTPFTPLEYRMSDESFQAAKGAPEGSAESFWSYAFYRGPNEEDDVKGKVRVHYCRNAHVAERALKYLLEEKLIGLDLEWVADSNKYSGPRRNVSLVQLASQSRVVLLHLALYPAKDELATPTLRQILENREITKLGVWIKGDCTRLRKFLGIDTQSIFELSHLFKQVKYSASGQPELINKKLVSLANQVRETMSLPMRKDQNVRASDWSQPLDMEQIGYSASDAYAAVQLFAMLNHKREKLDPVPALPFHADLGKPIPLPPGIESSSSDEANLDEFAADEAGLEAENGDGELTALRSEVLNVLEEVRDSLASLAGEDSSAGTVGAKVSKRKAAVAVAAAKSPSIPKDPRITDAEAWLVEYKEGRAGNLKASPAALRAYHIWHANAGLDAEAIARLLRDPPLQTTTVAGYILSSIHLEKLPYHETRMKTEVMNRLPADVTRKRYFTLWRAVNSVGVPPKGSTGDTD